MDDFYIRDHVWLVKIGDKSENASHSLQNSGNADKSHHCSSGITCITQLVLP